MSGNHLKLYYLDTTAPRSPKTGWGVVGDTTAGLIPGRVLQSGPGNQNIIALTESVPGVIANAPGGAAAPVRVAAGQYILAVDGGDTGSTGIVQVDPRTLEGRYGSVVTVPAGTPPAVTYTQLDGGTTSAAVFSAPERRDAAREATRVAVVGADTGGISGVTTYGFVYNGASDAGFVYGGDDIFVPLETAAALMRVGTTVIARSPTSSSTWQTTTAASGSAETTRVSAYFLALLASAKTVIDERGTAIWKNGTKPGAINTAYTQLEKPVGTPFTSQMLLYMMNMLNTRSSLVTTPTATPSAVMIPRIPFSESLVEIDEYNAATGLAAVNTKTRSWAVIDFPSSDNAVQRIMASSPSGTYQWQTPWPVVATTTDVTPNTVVTVQTAASAASSTVAASTVTATSSSSYYITAGGPRNTGSSFRFVSLEEDRARGEGYAMSQGKNAVALRGSNYIFSNDLWEPASLYQMLTPSFPDSTSANVSITAVSGLSTSGPAVMLATKSYDSSSAPNGFAYASLPIRSGAFVLAVRDVYGEHFGHDTGSWPLNRYTYSFEPMPSGVRSWFGLSNVCKYSTSVVIPTVTSNSGSMFSDVFAAAVAASDAAALQAAAQTVTIFAASSDPGALTAASAPQLFAVNRNTLPRFTNAARYEFCVDAHITLSDIIGANDFFSKPGLPVFALVVQFRVAVIPDLEFEGVSCLEMVWTSPLGGPMQSSYHINTTNSNNIRLRSFVPPAVRVFANPAAATVSLQTFLEKFLPSYINSPTIPATAAQKDIIVGKRYEMYTEIDRVYPMLLVGSNTAGVTVKLQSIDLTDFFGMEVISDDTISSRVFHPAFSLTITEHPIATPDATVTPSVPKVVTVNTAG